MKYTITLALCAFLTACNSSVTVPKTPDYGNRISLAEERISMLEANHRLMDLRVTALEERVDLFGESVTEISNSVTDLTQRVQSLETSVSSHDTRIAALEQAMSSVTSQLQSLTAAMSNVATVSQMNALSQQITDLNNSIVLMDVRISALEANQVKVYACQRPDSSLSKERFFKINSKLYAAMNYVTVGSVTVVTGQTSQTFTVPCVEQAGQGNSGLKFCSSGPTTTKSIPANTTGQVSVVKSVQIALEALVPNQAYVTTDNSQACYFDGSGTNLVEVQ